VVAIPGQRKLGPKVDAADALVHASDDVREIYVLRSIITKKSIMYNIYVGKLNL
jgi:hypothetical protein